MNETKIEYYPTCPSCGGVNANRPVCEYCGASLVKSVVQRSGEDGFFNQEMANEEADRGLPILHGSMSGINWFLIIFFGIFGGMFFMIPGFMLAAFIAGGAADLFVVLFLLSFMAIGAVPLFLIIRNIVNHGKCKNGTELSGEVRGYTDSMVTVNGRPLLDMRVLIYEQGQPKILVLGIHLPTRPYSIGQTIRMKRYKNSYLIVE